MRVGAKFVLVSAALSALYGQHVVAADSVSAPVDTTSLTNEQLAEIEKNKESMTFQTEVARMLDIIINSLYTQRDVFLRELISNAADALEKARFLSVSDSEYLNDKSELALYIDYDPVAKTLTLTDTGVGMSRSDLINNLGTLAKSGTTNFLEAIAGNSDVSLIGQFGVGFYSSYLVADKVTVVSKKRGEDQYIWESSADAQFTVVKDPRGNTLGRGSQIILHLKDDATEFTSADKIEELTTKYSQFISYPIYVKKSLTVKETVADEDNIDEATGEYKTKEVSKIETSFTQVNTQKAIWQRSKEDVTEEEYAEFYKTLTKDAQSPLAHTHFTAEGDIDFKSILYIPSKANKPLYENYMEKASSIKLYVRRVLVAEAVEEVLPKYLSFIKGVVDSDDLPLNVSREQLQQSRALRTIGKTLIKRSFDMLTRLSKEEVTANEQRIERVKEDKEAKKVVTESEKDAKRYNSFYGEFSKSLKMGCYEDDANRGKILKLLRFKSSQHAAKPAGYYGDYHGITLEQYIDNIPESKRDAQPSIYYIAGDAIDTLQTAPHLQVFKKKGIDVLFLTEPLDEACLQKAGEFAGKTLVNISKGDVKFEETADEVKRHQKLVKAFKPLTSWWKKQLGSNIGKVEVSKRLVSDPITITASSMGYSAQMERVMKTQAFVDASQLKMMNGMKNLEINPDHPIIQKLLGEVKATSTDGGEVSDVTKKTVKFLYDAAVIGAGFDLESPADFTTNLFNFLGFSYGIKDGEGVTLFNVDDIASEDDEDEKKGAYSSFGSFNEETVDFGFDGAEEIIPNDEL